MPRLLLANDEVMEFFNTLTPDCSVIHNPRPPTARQPLDPSPFGLSIGPSTTLDPSTFGLGPSTTLDPGPP